MVRDVHNFWRTDVRTHTAEFVVSGLPTQYNEYLYQEQSTFSKRDDPRPTLSVDGKYFIPTTYHAIFVVTTPRSGTAKWWNSRFTIRNTAYWPGAPIGFEWKRGTKGDYLPAVPAETLSGCREAVLQAMRSTDVDVGTTVGEMRESVTGIVDLARDLSAMKKNLSKGALALASESITYVRHLLKGNYRSPHYRAAKEYLRFMYGIRPLVMDAYAYASQIQDGFSSPNLFTVERKRTSDYNLQQHNAYPKTYYSGKLELGVKIGVEIVVRHPTAYALWQYGVTNPLAVAWELTTLSFVVDWFTGIGKFVRAIQQPIGCTARNGYETTYVDGHWTKHSRVLDSFSNAPIIYDGYATTDVNIKCMQRYTTLGFTPPPVYLSLGINSGQLSSLMAILTTLKLKG